jgi:hypothetical protein
MKLDTQNKRESFLKMIGMSGGVDRNEIRLNMDRMSISMCCIIMLCHHVVRNVFFCSSHFVQQDKDIS